MRALAQRIQHLTDQAGEVEAAMKPLVQQLGPALDESGIGVIRRHR